MEPDATPLPDYVKWSIFPFDGDLRVRPLRPAKESDRPREGEPGGGPCRCLTATDGEYIWVDDHWRVGAPRERSSLPVQLMLESREHLDLHELPPDRASELGQLMVRIDRAVLAVPGVGRTHFSRWGDGGSHFHQWVYARPLGSRQLLGFMLPLWEAILPRTPVDVWERNLAIVAAELARGGGRSMV